jgi:serine/threonine protein kinase
MTPFSIVFLKRSEDSLLAIKPGTWLGRYEIRSPIGTGGMGEVYLALDTELDRSVAIKILPEVVADQQRLQRFIQEAKAASALNHPHILTIFEIGQVDSVRFIATEFIEGDTLRQQILRGSLQLAEVLDIAIQAAGALSAAHAAGIIHRDIKPENIMRRRDGRKKRLTIPAGTKLGHYKSAGSFAKRNERALSGQGRCLARLGCRVR